MKSHNSKYFVNLLQICSFFKYNVKPWQSQINEAIRLMSLDQLFVNIMNKQFETVLIKQIIIFLVGKLKNPKFLSNHEGGVSQFLIGQLQGHKKELIEQYYMQMALQQYFWLTNQQQNIKQYAKIYNFYELNDDIKFNLLSSLVENVRKYSYANQSKIKKQEVDVSKNDTDTKQKSAQIEEILILGQDGKQVYYFASFLPQYVFTSTNHQWNILDRKSVISRIIKIVSSKQSSNLLFLAQNLSTVQKKYMANPNQNPIHIRLNKIKQKPAVKQKQRVKLLQQKLLKINERYNNYLFQFDRRCWSYLKHRKSYQTKIKQATHLDQLIQAFNQFYLVSRSKIYKILCDDQQQIPVENCQQYYSPQNRVFCNINTVSNKIASDLHLRSQQISKKIIQEQHADLYALFQLNVMVLEMAVRRLQIKSEKYHQKQKLIQAQRQKLSANQQAQKQPQPKKILRNRASSRSSISRISSNRSSIVVEKQTKNTRKLRNRKYGVTMIDSGSESQESQYQQADKIQKYAYNTRKMKSRV